MCIEIKEQHGTKREEPPCSNTNPLGTFGLWFEDRFVLDLHGRPPNFDQAKFFNTTPEQRRDSFGCIVAPYEQLTNFLVNVILETPALKDNKRALNIKDSLKTNKLETISIPIRDADKRPAPKPDGVAQEDHDKNTVALDIKVLIVNTGDRSVWPALNTSKVADPYLALLSTNTLDAASAFYMVTDCTVKTPTNVYYNEQNEKDVATKEPLNLQPGDQVLGVYNHPWRSSTDIMVVFQDNVDGVIKDADNLECSAQYYSSTSNKALLQTNQ